FFTGALWLMGRGAWEVRFGIDGAAGAETTSVPVAAVATAILHMQRPMGIMLGALGVILVLGIVGIVTAAVREARLKPGAQPNEGRRRRAALAGVIALAVSCFAVYWGGKWWNVEAADYATDMHRNAELRPTIDGNRLNLMIGDMLLDHGHLMHLYAIREPGMDAVFHLHPEPTGKQGLSTVLPAMPAG